MNYIEQIKGFWITQEINQLSTSEIAMYFYFLEIWNKAGWTDSFKRNNYKVMGDLSIRSFKTLHGIRNRLQQVGILEFDQTNGVANVKYTMADLSKIYRGKVKGQEENNDLSKKYQGSGQGSGKGLGKGKGKGSGQGSGKVNINVNSSTETSKSHSVADAPAPKKKKHKKKRLYWQEFIDQWDRFYIAQKTERYSYLEKDFDHLGKVYDFLKKRAERKSIPWSQETMSSGFGTYLEAAYSKDEWLRKNFCTANLLSQFNQIANGNNQTSGNNFNRAKSRRGGTIEELQALKRKPKGPVDGGSESGRLQDPAGGEDWSTAEVVR